MIFERISDINILLLSFIYRMRLLFRQTVICIISRNFFFITDEKHNASPATLFIIILSLDVSFFKRSGIFLKSSVPCSLWSERLVLNRFPFAVFRGSLTGELLENAVEMTETSVTEHVRNLNNRFFRVL